MRKEHNEFVECLMKLIEEKLQGLDLEDQLSCVGSLLIEGQHVIYDLLKDKNDFESLTSHLFKETQKIVLKTIKQNK